MSSIFCSNSLFREECLYGIQRDVLHPLLVGIGKHGAAESLLFLLILCVVLFFVCKVTENKSNMQSFYIFMNVQPRKNYIFMNVQPRKNHIFMNVRGISWLPCHVLLGRYQDIIIQIFWIVSFESQGTGSSTRKSEPMYLSVCHEAHIYI